MRFVTAAQTADVPTDSMTKVLVEGHEVLLANVGGSFYAVAERCTHLRGHLAAGTLEDGIVTCPRHGSKFDVRTGEVVGGAQILFLKMQPSSIRTYPVKIEGQDVLIALD